MYRIVFYFFTLGIISLYSALLKYDVIVGITPLRFMGMVNILLIPTVIWILARSKLYPLWGLYILLVTAYYGLITPNYPIILEIIIYGTAVAINLLLVFDVFIANCNGITTRSLKRWTWPKTK